MGLAKSSCVTNVKSVGSSITEIHCVPKSDAKIQITKLRYILLELNIFSATLIIAFPTYLNANVSKINYTVLSNWCLKNRTEEHKFPVMENID